MDDKNPRDDAAKSDAVSDAELDKVVGGATARYQPVTGKPPLHEDPEAGGQVHSNAP